MQGSALATPTFTAQAALTIALIVGLLFLVAAPIAFLEVRAPSEAIALAALEAFGETVARDTTEERERQLRVAGSLRLLTVAEDMAEIGHWRFRIGEDSVSWSPGCHRIHGRAPGTPVTMAMVMGHYAPAEAKSVTSMIDRILSRGNGDTLVTEIVRADGATRRVAIQSLPEYGASGELEALFGVMRDITEAHDDTLRLTAAREAADAAAADRAQLLAAMSHEIRTPMIGIIGMLDLLGEGGGRVPDDISVAGDPARVQHILSNLIGNAVKLTAQGGVTIGCHRDAAGMITVTITDTGIGIAAAAVPTLFDAWRQADAGIARAHGGSGLGLSICRKLAEAMGGSITVASVVGQGSRFTLGLPLPAATLADAGPAMLADADPAMLLMPARHWQRW